MENDQYYEMFAKVQSGIISEEVWKEYCFDIFSKATEETKDVFIRLKNRKEA
jgi:hypothetical protein